MKHLPNHHMKSEVFQVDKALQEEKPTNSISIMTTNAKILNKI